MQTCSSKKRLVVRPDSERKENTMQNPEYAPILFHSTPSDLSTAPQLPVQPAGYILPPDFLAFIRQTMLQIRQAERCRDDALATNNQLQRRLAEKEAKEFAYRTAMQSDDCIVTWSETGRPIQLLNHRLEWAAHLRPQPPFSERAFYVVKLHGVAPEAIWSEQEFQNDTAFLQALRELPGVQVNFVRTAKRTAMLLRQAISDKIQVIVPAFWGGWLRTEAGAYNFYQLGSCATHFDGVRLETLSNTVPAQSPAVTATAAQQFGRYLAMVREPMVRWLLAVWFHAAALSTLLDQLGHPMPVALCVFTADPGWLAFLKELFGWFGDVPLSLDEPPTAFSKRVLCRKDEPLVVLDQHRTKNAAINSALMEDVLANRQIPWKLGRQSEFFPLQALPVILTSAASALSCSPAVVLLEVSPGDLDVSACTTKPGDAWEMLWSHLQSFIGWTADRIDHLVEALEHSRQRAYQYAGDILTEDYVQALGVLLGIDAFLRRFFRCCGDSAFVPEDEGNEWESWLLALLEQASEKELDCSDLAGQFIAIARSQLLSGALHACPTEYRSLPASDIVFFNDQFLGFTAEAFRQVCRQLSQSRPVVLRTLREAGLLQGRPVNVATGLTRISIWKTLFKDWAPRCLELYKKPYVKGNTYTGTYLTPVNKHLIPYFGKVALDDIRPIQIQAYVNEMSQKFAPETVKKDFTILSFIMQHAVENGLCSANPARKSIRLPRVERAAKTAYTQVEYDKAYAFATTHPNGTSIMLLMETGISRSELLGLRWEDIDTESRVIHIRQGLVAYQDLDEKTWVTEAKGLKNSHRRRDIPIVDDALIERLETKPRSIMVKRREHAKEERVEPEFVFHSPEGLPYQPNNWSNRVFFPFMDDLHKVYPEFPSLTPHELRHTRATLWLAQGISPLMVAKLLGHSDTKMLAKIYDHTTVDTLRNVIIDAKKKKDSGSEC